MKKFICFILALLLLPSFCVCAFAATGTLNLSEYPDEVVLILFETVCEDLARRDLSKEAVLDAGKELFQKYLDLDLDDQLPSSSSRSTNRSVDSKSNVTSGMKNALKSAQDYLSFTAFSYSGLIDQLKYEGYSLAEATYAADHCGADWNEQAYQSAKSYLSFMSFSCSRLIEQLEYEGFTHAQAVYGVDKAY